MWYVHKHTAETQNAETFKSASAVAAAARVDLWTSKGYRVSVELLKQVTLQELMEEAECE